MTRQEILAIAKPILFNTEMVRTILDDRKTATRRVIKPRYRAGEAGFQVITTMKGEFVRIEKVDEDECGIFMDGTKRYVNPPYKPGDYLYVRETWAFDTGDSVDDVGTGYFIYKADEQDSTLHHWRPSIHMPKEAARIFLRVTNVRAERLREMVLADMLMEGIQEADSYEGTWDRWHNTWNSTIKPADLPVYGWKANPWVWVIEFERETPEVR